MSTNLAPNVLKICFIIFISTVLGGGERVYAHPGLIRIEDLRSELEDIFNACTYPYKDVYPSDCPHLDEAVLRAVKIAEEHKLVHSIETSYILALAELMEKYIDLPTLFFRPPYDLFSRVARLKNDWNLIDFQTYVGKFRSHDAIGCAPFELSLGLMRDDSVFEIRPSIAEEGSIFHIIRSRTNINPILPSESPCVTFYFLRY